MELNIWLIGAGPMAVEYAKVLTHLGHTTISIGRGESSAENFERATGITSIRGGLDEFINQESNVPHAAIVATGVEALYQNSTLLLQHGVKKILIEKPGATTREELENLCELADRKSAEIYIAYNRRFYASVQQAKRMIKEDGGVQSFQFEFTEWSHVIGKLTKAEGIKQLWFLMNSTHVADMAFFLGGKPVELSHYHRGGLGWHPASSRFSGAGVTDGDALFSYNANWQAPGRWSLELQSGLRRYIFRPLEKLQIMEKGSIATEEVAADHNLDTQFKPGLYKQTQAFLSGDSADLCGAKEQLGIWDLYMKIAGYDDQARKNLSTTINAHEH